MPFVNCTEAGKNLVAFVIESNKGKPSYLQSKLPENEPERDIIIVELGEVECAAGKTLVAISTLEIRRTDEGFFVFYGSLDVEKRSYFTSWGRRLTGRSLSEQLHELLKAINEANIPQDEKDIALAYVNELVQQSKLAKISISLPGTTKNPARTIEIGITEDRINEFYEAMRRTSEDGQPDCPEAYGDLLRDLIRYDM